MDDLRTCMSVLWRHVNRRRQFRRTSLLLMRQFQACRDMHMHMFAVKTMYMTVVRGGGGGSLGRCVRAVTDLMMCLVFLWIELYKLPAACP